MKLYSEKRIATVAAAVLVALAISCTKEFFHLENDRAWTEAERHVQCSAELPKNTLNNKAWLDYNDGLKVKWQNGDAININGTSLVESGITYYTTAHFNGATRAMVKDGNDLYWAVHPTFLSGTDNSSIPNHFSDDRLQVTFPAVQRFSSSNKPLEGNSYMAAFAEVPSGENNVALQMRNLGAVLRLTMGTTAKASCNLARIEFSSTTGKLSGGFTVTNNGNIAITPAGNASGRLIFDVSEGGAGLATVNGLYELSIIFPPLADNDLTMKAYGTNGKYYKRSIASVTMERNKIYTNRLLDLEFDLEDPYYTANSNGDRIAFAPGNLQYQASTGTWRFAENQYDYIGNDVGNTTNSGHATQSHWIDLFGWGTSGHDNTLNDALAINFHPYDTSSQEISTTNNVFGYGPSSNMTDGSLVGTSELYDWGMKNRINNPKTNEVDAARTWRCLTAAEWNFVFNTRPAATVNGVANARFVKATVCGVSGIIIFPDDFINVGHQLRDINDATSQRYPRNTYTNDEWPAMEEAGCVFLPCAGYRDGATTLVIGDGGQYWSATCNSSKGAKYFRVNTIATQNGSRYCGRSVRLVKDL